VEVELLLEILVELVPVVVVGRALEVHLLDFLLLRLNTGLEGVHFIRDLGDKVPHDEILLVEGEEDGEKVSIIPSVAVADLFLYLFKAATDLLLLLQALLELLINPKIFLLLEFDIGLVFLNFPLQSFELLPLHFFGFNELLES
jgi:hypothetical protein